MTSPTDSTSADPDHADSQSKRLFDLRVLIAGLFSVYGVILIITGALDGKAALAKASGVRINLWTGIGSWPGSASRRCATRAPRCRATRPRRPARRGQTRPASRRQ